MRELGPDELFLRGRLQISTALEALVASGINPDAETQLANSLYVHELLSTGEDQVAYGIYLQGGETERTRADIIMSLELFEQNSQASPDATEAARGLLELLRTK